MSRSTDEIVTAIEHANGSAYTTTIEDLAASDAEYYDYIIVGGGTAGCVIASRLPEYLPNARVLLIEAGPSDYGNDMIADLKAFNNLQMTELDYDYGIVEQPNGNSHIRQSRAKVLGGCSSHNACISFHPYEIDTKRWQRAGAEGWDFNTIRRVFKKLRTPIRPVPLEHSNELNQEWAESGHIGLNVPKFDDFNEEIATKGQVSSGSGWIPVAYRQNADRSDRISASTAYIHPILQGKEKKPNLKILTGAWVSRINVSGDSVSGINVTLKSGKEIELKAKEETILCAGAIDTPRLLLLSGIGPKEQLESLRIPVVRDMQGVGENLQDHIESLVIWEMKEEVPKRTVMQSDVGVFLRREPEDVEGNAADILIHMYQFPLFEHSTRLGYDSPENVFCAMPNVPRPKSRGRVYLSSADPKIKPSLDFRYFTDLEGYDAATIVAGIKASRKLAASGPFKERVLREVAPGPKCQTDEEISEYGRRVSCTVYHPCGTARIGNTKIDPLAVVDSELRVRDVKGLRIADASVFPTVPSINPVATVLCVGERAAEIIAADAGAKI